MGFVGNCSVSDWLMGFVGGYLGLIVWRGFYSIVRKRINIRYIVFIRLV